MRSVRIIMAIIWGLMAIGLVFAAIADFTWFYVLMAIGCTGTSILSILEYRWSAANNWQDEG